MNTPRANSPRASPADLAAMTVHEAAAYWFLRREGGEGTPEDAAAFERWCAESETHARAYEAVRATWSTLDSNIEPSELRALRAAALSVPPASRRWPLLAGSAA